jgi:iron complex transport system ATP-binding protein
MTAVSIHGLSITLGELTILSDVDLSVDAGEFLAIVGPNGSGKTTLLRAMAGAIDPTAGSVRLSGRDASSLSPFEAAGQRSFLTGSHEHDLGFPVETVVGFGTYAAVGDSDATVLRSMERVGIEHLASRSVGRLSGGEQRRVSIARVLSQNAPVVLLDEPTDSLDLGHADMVMATASLEAANGRAVVCTSHDLNVTTRHANRMALLHQGRIVASGAPSDVLDARLLSEVYETEVTVMPHPATGSPVVFV